MKKILLAVAFVMMIGVGASAQKNDNFFRSYDNGVGNRDNSIGNVTPLIPSYPTVGDQSGDVDAPLGSGLLVLTALGAGYALRKKKH